jgi:3-oxoacyl-[acyl-carrier-protein] synthase III
VKLTVDGKKAEWTKTSLEVGKGDLLVLEAMGGGFTWGAAVVRY